MPNTLQTDPRGQPIICGLNHFRNGEKAISDIKDIFEGVFAEQCLAEHTWLK